MKIEKYSRVTREDYEQWFRENASLREKVDRDSLRLRYHLMPETGWLNDPNGLMEWNGTYHIYYQYDPFDAEGNLKLWNHCATRDFVHYENWGPVLFPDQDFDAHGVYSGSAFPEGGTAHFFYTGNVKCFDRPDYDYITAGRKSTTVRVDSPDGQHFSEKKVLLTPEDYPDDISCHVRDPKILKYEGMYYMVLGARDLDDCGQVLLYRSEDMERWEYFSRIRTREPFGYMWECPDLFFLEGKLLLICCPQGVQKVDLEYENVYQCVCMAVSGDLQTGELEVAEEAVYPSVDRGFDFYAPQIFEDETGRRILIGWMGIPDAPYENPTAERGWQHALTLPRELHLRDGRLIQTPLEELKKLRREEWKFSTAEELALAGEKMGRREGPVFEAVLEFSSCSAMRLQLRQGTELIYENGLLSLEIRDGGCGRTVRHGKTEELRDLRIFSDVSSLEIFVNGGEMVFSTRVYADCCPDSEAGEGYLYLQGGCRVKGSVYRLSEIIMEKRGDSGAESSENMVVTK